MSFVVPSVLEQISLEFSLVGIGYRNGQGFEQVQYFREDCNFYQRHPPQEGCMVFFILQEKGPNGVKGGVFLVEGDTFWGDVNPQILQGGSFPAIGEIGP